MRTVKNFLNSTILHVPVPWHRWTEHLLAAKVYAWKTNPKFVNVPIVVGQKMFICAIVTILAMKIKFFIMLVLDMFFKWVIKNTFEICGAILKKHSASSCLHASSLHGLPVSSWWHHSGMLMLWAYLPLPYLISFFCHPLKALVILIPS